ncbi:MAG: hypothetical protein ABIG20_03430 [archaeon]
MASDPKLVQYVRDQLTAGYMLSAIKEELLISGYSPRTVQDVILEVHGANIPSAASAGSISLPQIPFAPLHPPRVSELKQGPPRPSNVPKFAAAGLLVIIFVAVAYGFGLFPSGGSTVSLGELEIGESVEFTVDGDAHSLELEDVGDDYIDVLVSSEPQRFRILVGETRAVDLDGDDVDDITITLNSIEDGKPDVDLKKIPKSSSGQGDSGSGSGSDFGGSYETDCICSEIESPDGKIMCEALLKNDQDICKQIDVLHDDAQDEGWWDYEDNYEYCYDNFGILAKEAAVEQNDVNVCHTFYNDYRCELAKGYETKQICRYMEKNLDCIEKLAIINKDPAICDQIITNKSDGGLYYKQKCYTKAYYAIINSGDKSLCSRLEGRKPDILQSNEDPVENCMGKDPSNCLGDCQFYMAQDINTCREMKDSYEKDLCIVEHATDISQCDEIPNEMRAGSVTKCVLNTAKDVDACFNKLQGMHPELPDAYFEMLCNAHVGTNTNNLGLCKDATEVDAADLVENTNLFDSEDDILDYVTWECYMPILREKLSDYASECQDYTAVPDKSDEDSGDDSSCTPDWSCSSWNTCSSEGIQMRYCRDLHFCNTTEGMPAIQRECELGGGCTPSWDCSSWGECSNSRKTRTCTDTNNCDVNTSKPFTTKYCVQDCTPDWNCSSWGACNGGFQNRYCYDVNKCATNDGAPETRQSCASEDNNENSNCTPLWDCQKWLSCTNGVQSRNCFDWNYCGTNAGKPDTSRSCDNDAPVTENKPCSDNGACNALGWFCNSPAGGDFMEGNCLRYSQLESDFMRCDQDLLEQQQNACPYPCDHCKAGKMHCTYMSDGEGGMINLCRECSTNKECDMGYECHSMMCVPQ